MSALIASRLEGTSLWNAAGTVLFYASIRSEVDTKILIDRCLQRAVRTVLPRVDKKAAKLILYQILSRDDLKPGAFGVPEPACTEQAPVPPAEIDCAIIPGVAFDATGARLGYGKGYYDRLLADMKTPAVGLCYEHQLVGHIPCEPHDRRVAMIITEKRIIYCDGYQKN